jgi:hypothetical protein
MISDRRLAERVNRQDTCTIGIEIPHIARVKVSGAAFPIFKTVDGS